MKGMKANRIKIKVGNLWESPVLHVLLTKEDDLVVARCLDLLSLAMEKMRWML